jgi:hypothetical protein
MRIVSIALLDAEDISIRIKIEIALCRFEGNLSFSLPTLRQDVEKLPRMANGRLPKGRSVSGFRFQVSGFLEWEFLCIDSIGSDLHLSTCNFQPVTFNL